MKWTMAVLTIAIVLSGIGFWQKAFFARDDAEGRVTMTPAWVMHRIRPIGEVVVRERLKGDILAAEEIVHTQCALCHLSGVSGAPRLGRREEWRARLDAGFTSLVTATRNGKGLMPPRGGMDLTDEQIHQAVQVMVQAVDPDFSKEGIKNENPLYSIK